MVDEMHRPADGLTLPSLPPPPAHRPHSKGHPRGAGEVRRRADQQTGGRAEAAGGRGEAGGAAQEGAAGTFQAHFFPC